MTIDLFVLLIAFGVVWVVMVTAIAIGFGRATRTSERRADSAEQPSDRVGGGV